MVEITGFDPIPILAKELDLPARGVAAVVELLGGNATVPFIARYRKEVTGGLDEVQIRDIQDRTLYLEELEERRQAILESISDQGKLTGDLENSIRTVSTKSELEDLYLPYKPRRRTRATIAREKGLEPLALTILSQPDSGQPEESAAAFVNPDKGVEDAEAALRGARDIVAETMAENADVRGFVRNGFARSGILHSEAVPKKTQLPTKFEQYYDFHEAVARIPSHRFLAIRRGEREGVLRVKVDIDEEPALRRIERMMGAREGSPFRTHLVSAIEDGYKRLLAPSVETDVRADLKRTSDENAVNVFADNLRNLLLAAPLGGKAVIGIDPGLRTGCKCVALDTTGKFLDHLTIFPTRGEAGAARAKVDLLAFCDKHRPAAIAVGNGTGGRETEAFVRRILEEAESKDVFVVQVNESGASVYSASKVAREEFPDLDLTIRGAISIARRLQDPLAELVKIDPKAIGVGQYQHDVHQPLLKRKLDEVVESCVNHVGVDVNTASAPLLSHVAGIRPAMARNVVLHREKHGAFRNRRKLLDVSGLGPRAFEQAAGFLRIHNGSNPLDASAVHPERYELVGTITRDLGLTLEDLVGNPAAADRIQISRYVSGDVGEPTLRDIVSELKKPGRDPRDSFTPPRFREDVTELEDLEVDMVLEGVVTNVTGFGAFVDVGVHQDGLVHISQLADRYVRDPGDVVKVGDRITVRVLEVDVPRKRISLSAKKDPDGSSANRPSRR